MEPCVSIHMKRLSAKWFSQIMINKVLKKELDSLKQNIRIQHNMNYNLSYGDVITILVKHYKEERKEYSIEEKLLVSVPLKQIPLSWSNNLDSKTRVSFSVES